MLESSAHVGDWRSIVAWTAHEAYRPNPPIPPGTATVLVVDFVMPRPKSMRKETKPHTSRPDVDKLLRAVGDALTAVVWADDGQATQCVGSKRYAEPDEPSGARIMVGLR